MAKGLLPPYQAPINKTLAVIAEFTDPTDTPPVPPRPDEKRTAQRDRQRKNAAQRIHKQMGSYFRKNWKAFADALVIVAQDPTSKPSERISAAKTALEFGFGRAAAQDQSIPAEKPTISFTGLPTVADMKKRGDSNKKPKEQHGAQRPN